MRADLREVWFVRNGSGYAGTAGLAGHLPWRIVVMTFSTHPRTCWALDSPLHPGVWCCCDGGHVSSAKRTNADESFNFSNLKIQLAAAHNFLHRVSIWWSRRRGHRGSNFGGACSDNSVVARSYLFDR
ncbi:hypothetical protein EJB05_14300, partial [Eragrostis curvula]